MSRFGDDDYEGDHPELDYGRWERNLKAAINGKRGQVILRELREALLALPERRLIAGELATPDGEVCTIGALVAYKRAKATACDITEAAKAVAAEDPCSWDGFERTDDGWAKQVHYPYMAEGETVAIYHNDDGYGSEHTIAMGKKVGLVQTLAYHLGSQNDDIWRNLTPEQRWERCYEWVNSKLTADVTP